METSLQETHLDNNFSEITTNNNTTRFQEWVGEGAGGVTDPHYN
jgi:hypothetical protein